MAIYSRVCTDTVNKLLKSLFKGISAHYENSDRSVKSRKQKPYHTLKLLSDLMSIFSVCYLTHIFTYVFYNKGDHIVGTKHSLVFSQCIMAIFLCQ